MDIGLLYAAALEASGIPSALVPLEKDSGGGFPPDDFVVACRLGINREEAELLFNGLEKVLVIDGQVWIPLSMNAFNGGFTAAWDGGAEALDRVFAEGAEANFIMTEKAWGMYPPAPLPARGGGPVRAGGEDLAQAADGVMRQYIDRHILPLAAALQREIAAGPAAAGVPLAGLYNRLGILFVRSGRAAEAGAAYERAAGMGSVPAMANRGNLALIEKDYAAAERWFARALEGEPENRTALRGMEQVREKRE
ncbi:MAG: hypothetical protein LBS06_02010 [Treponema sp.]|nr:hypothetical protein [Treponema sp.]